MNHEVAITYKDCKSFDRGSGCAKPNIPNSRVLRQRLLEEMKILLVKNTNKGEKKGNRKVSANLPNLPSGIYTYRCEFDDTSFHNGTLKIMR